MPTTVFGNWVDAGSRQFLDAFSVYVEITWGQWGTWYTRIFDFGTGHQDNSDLMLCGVGDAVQNPYMGAGFYENNQWYFFQHDGQPYQLGVPIQVLVVFTHESVTLTVNGDARSMTPGPSMINMFRTQNYIGQGKGAADDFQGTLAHFKIWDEVVSFEYASGLSTTAAPSVAPTAAPTATPTAPPTPSPTPSPTSAPTPASTVAGIGDPHLVNTHGQKFDLFQPGYHTLIEVPRWARRKTSFLVRARATRAGAGCADLYFTEINISGTWAQKYTAKNLRWVAEAPKPRYRAKWITFHDTISVKVVHGHTIQNTRYLNILVKGLGKTKVPVGGLLGEDDHTAAATPSKGCRRVVTL
jgi:hypothetical protein